MKHRYIEGNIYIREKETFLDPNMSMKELNATCHIL